MFIENSAIIGEFDKRANILTGLKKLKESLHPFSDDWNSKIIEKYFETLKLANNVARTICSKHYGYTRFFAFYQPYVVSNPFIKAHNEIRSQIRSIKFVFDVSQEYNALKDVYRDSVHVNQCANEIMGKRIASIIVDELQK